MASLCLAGLHMSAVCALKVLSLTSGFGVVLSSDDGHISARILAAGWENKHETAQSRWPFVWSFREMVFSKQACLWRVILKDRKNFMANIYSNKHTHNNMSLALLCCRILNPLVER